MNINTNKAILFIIIASFAYAISSLMIKIISQQASYSLILFARFLICFLIVTPLTINNINAIKTHRIKLHILRGLAGLLALGTFIYSINYISIVNAMLLNNVTPLFIPLLLFVGFGKRISAQLFISILIGFFGVILILNPSSNLFHLASLIALSSSLFAAIASISIRVLSKSEKSKTILFYYFLIATIGSSIFFIFNAQMITFSVSLYLLLIGVLGIIFQFSVTKAFTYAPAQIVSPLLYLSVIIGALFDWLFFNQTPTIEVLIGFVLIVVGSYFTIFYSKKVEAKLLN